jgi:RimJ/RimL family protein N-acetyltransferase
MDAVIETNRLLLCTFTDDDTDLIYQLNRDPKVTRYTCDPVFDLDQAKKYWTKLFCLTMPRITMADGQHF